MHECPWCGQACACDMEDVWHDAPRDCLHNCEEEDEEEFDNDDD